MGTNIKEIWKDITGYEGRYKVSNLGKVKSLISNRILSPVCIQGYLLVDLSANGKAIKKFIHRLVAIHFIPNPDSKPQVNHKKGNKKDNRATQLEWVTDRENKVHAYYNNLINNKPRKFLTNDEKIIVIELYKKTKDTTNYSRLGRQFGVSRCVVRRLVAKFA